MAYDYLTVFQDPGPKRKVKILGFDALTGSFTAENVIYQTVGGVLVAYATIDSVHIDGTEGELYLSSDWGTFQDNEIIYESALGSELITNGDMELDANWSNYGTPTVNERSAAQKYAGSYSRKFTSDENYEGIYGSVFTTVTGNFYTITGYVYPDDDVNVSILVREDRKSVV